MKSFREHLKESVTKVTTQSGITAVGVNLNQPDEVKKLLNQFDWYAEMIDDGTKHRQAMNANREVLKKLKGYGVDIVSNPSYLGMTGKKGREINLKLLKESEEAIANFAKKSGKDVDDVEALWNKAKVVAAEEGREDDYAYITGILKKMLSLNENGDEDEGEADMSIADTVINILLFAMQTHIYHLLTKGYAEHVAIGEFYAAIQGQGDSIAEMFIGIGGDMSQYDVYDAEISVMYTKESFIEEIQEFRETITNAISMTNEPSVMSLNDEFIAVQKSVDELLYKLTLS